jgi:VanZ family protein
MCILQKCKSVVITTQLVLRMVPMIVVMGTIFFLSHQPGDSLPLPPVVNIDKVAHMVIYGILAGAVIFGFLPSFRKSNPLTVACTAVLVCTLYGFSDEFHQTFISMRQASRLDMVADFSGALMVSGFWFFTVKKHIN